MAHTVGVGHQSRENYNRFSYLIVENTRNALVCLFEFGLSDTKHCSYEEFLNQNQHDIYHMCFKKPCCQCNPAMVHREKNLMKECQLAELYDKASNQRLKKHKKHERNVNEYCCRNAKSHIRTDHLDISLCKLLFDSLCADVFWSCCLKGSCLQQFLNKHKHTLYHMWKGTNNGHCCEGECRSTMKHRRYKITSEQWNMMFKATELPCSTHRDKNDAICTMSAIADITTSDLDNKLSTGILAACCTIKQAVDDLVEMRNKLYAHAKTAKMSHDDYSRYSTRVEDHILLIASVCNKRHEMARQLIDTKTRPFLDEVITLHIQTKILEEMKDKVELKESVENIEERLKHIEVAMTDQGERQKLQNEIKERTRSEVQTHIKEGTFVKTNVIPKGIELLQSNGIVVLTGKTGSGKSRNSLEIMKLYAGSHEGYEMIKLGSLHEWKTRVSITDRVVIFFEDIFGKTNSRFNEDVDSQLLDELYASTESGNNKFIITIRDTIKKHCEQIFEKHRIFNDEFILDLSSERFEMNKEERHQCVRNYCKKSNIDITTGQDNLWEDSTEDNMVTVILNEDTVRDIVESNPGIGFPQAVYLYTSNRKFTRRGAVFFSDACSFLQKEIVELRQDGKKLEMKRWQYVALVYTMLAKCNLRSGPIDKDLIAKIMQSVYRTDLPGNFNELLQRAANELTGKYLCCKSEAVHSPLIFQHQTILEAVLVSYGEKDPASVISSMSFDFITEMARPFQYQQREGETVFKVPHKYYKMLSRRLVEIMLSEFKHRKLEFTELLCKAEIIRQTEEEVLCLMIEEYDRQMEKHQSCSDLRVVHKSMSETALENIVFHFPAAILEKLICYRENDHVVEELVEKVIDSLNCRTREDIKEACRLALVNILKDTCASGTIHRLKIIHKLFQDNHVPYDINLCMQASCKRRNVQCATWLFENVVIQSSRKENNSNDGPSSIKEVMMAACRDNDIPLVRWLLENFEESDLSLDKAVSDAYKNGRMELVQCIVNRVDDHERLQLKYILTKACYDSRKDLVIHLLDSVDHKYFNLIFTMNEMCSKGKITFVKILWEKIDNKKLFNMKSAMNLASRNGWKDLVGWLLANTDRSEFDMNEALAEAIKQGRKELEKWLKIKIEDLKTDKDVVKESSAYFGWAEPSNAEIDDNYAKFPFPVAPD